SAGGQGEPTSSPPRWSSTPSGSGSPLREHRPRAARTPPPPARPSSRVSGPERGVRLENPQEFYTFQSLPPLAGATRAVPVVANTVRTLLNFTSKWLNFAVAVLIAYAGAGVTGALESFAGWIVAALNGCLLFLTAAGMQQAAVSATTARPAGEATPQSA